MKDEAEPQCPAPSAARTRRQTARLLLAAVASLSASLSITDADATVPGVGKVNKAGSDANQGGTGQPHKSQPHAYVRKKLPGRMKSGTLTKEQ